MTIIILCVIIVIGATVAFLTILDVNLFEKEIKTYNFEAFSMNVSADREFIKNDSTNEVYTYIDKDDEIIISYVYTDNLYDAISAYNIKTIVDENPTIGKNEFRILDNPNENILNKITVYKYNDNSTGQEKYLALYNGENVVIVIVCNDLDELIEMINTININNKNINNNSDIKDVDYPKKSNNNINIDSSDEDDYLEQLRRENAEADAREICPSCGVYTGSEGKYCIDCYDEISGGEEYQGGYL